jgi:peptidoglycan/xylan/chitin deacetylase (PgdA/CDA1 family)
MALSIASSSSAAVHSDHSGVGELLEYRNDAFSFWKLPENYRALLEQSSETSEPLIRRYLFEEYLSPHKRMPSSSVMTYYRVKRFIPLSMRHWINYAAVHARLRDAFPNWPCETALLDLWHHWLRESLDAIGQQDPWHVAFWPNGKRCCIALTHDVESPSGFARMERMADLEERYGFKSSWNLPLAQYPIDWKALERLRARGFELGAHGLAHDGRMFRSRHDFEVCKLLVERLAGEHDLRGFRGPSTLRNAEWIGTMAFEYDSTFSDTDPYEPQPGGTCSLFPFFLSEMVELPYTLPQDHTLIHLVRRSPLSTWVTKAHWIQSLGGMILVLTHPDYSGDDQHISNYEELLKVLSDFDAWRALPYEVAQWWRDRARLKLTLRDGKPSIEGPAARRAVARRVSEESFVG